MKITTLNLLLILVSLSWSQISFSSCPNPKQLYARDAADSAVVEVSGVVTLPGQDSLVVQVTKDDSAFFRWTLLLSYSAEGAPFSVSPKIHAELAEYRVKVFLDTALVLDCDSIVCGDAFIIDGQSNAVTLASGGPKGINEWLRSFGRGPASKDLTADTSQVRADTIWGRGHDCSTCSNGSRFFVGAWGFRLGEKIIQDMRVPVCIINNALGGSVIASHLPNPSNRLSLATLYGRMLFRTTQAGLNGKIKAMFWHQGESDDASYSSTQSNYLKRFDTLYTAWHQDYSALEKCYVFQIRPRYNIPEAQRRIADLYPDVSLMSTAANAVLSSDGTHYTLDGYYTLGNWLYPLVARDFYGVPDTAPYIDPPKVKRAFYTNKNKDQVVLEFDQPVSWMNDTTVIAGTDTIHAFLKDYFAFDTSHGMVDTGYALPERNSIVLRLKSVSTATAISYINKRYYLPWGHITPSDNYNKYSYQGPWLLNPRRIGALLFTGLPLTQDTTFYLQAEKSRKANDLSLELFIQSPVSNCLNFQIKAETMAGTEFSFHDIQGRKVGVLKADRLYGNLWKGSVDVTGLAAGVYFGRVHLTDGRSLSRPFVVIR